MKQIRPRTIDQYRQKLITMSKLGRNGCIEYIGPRSPKGYGKIKYFRKDVRAHRLAYELAKGSIPEGLFVLHRCDNPPCINIDHLFIGDAKDNAIDRMIKGRGNNQWTIAR